MIEKEGREFQMCDKAYPKRGKRRWSVEPSNETSLHRRLSLSVSSYHDTFAQGEMKLPGFLETASRLGFSSVELCDRSVESTDISYLEEVRSRLKKKGLSVSCVAIRNDFTHYNEPEQCAQLCHVARWLEVASFLGAPVTRVWAGVESVSDSSISRVCRAFCKLIRVARTTGVKMALENHGGVTANPDNAIRIVSLVGSPWLGTCPDFGWFAPADRYYGLERLVPYAVHMHAKSYSFDADGNEESIDYALIGDIVLRHRYGGYISIEYEGSGQSRAAGIMQTVVLVQKYFFTPGGGPLPLGHRKKCNALLLCEKDGRHKSNAADDWISQIATKNIWYVARKALEPFIQRLVTHPEVEGIVILGGLADCEGRRFIDEHSDLDLAAFLDIPSAEGFVDPKEFALSHPQDIPDWLPEFQFYVPVGKRWMEVNCHQLIMQIEASSKTVWNERKIEAYQYTGEIVHDRHARVAELIRTKTNTSPDVRMNRLIVIAGQLPWYGWINPERQLCRGFRWHALLLLNEAVFLLIEMIFLINDRERPHSKWLFEIACSLPWLPRGFRKGIEDFLSCQGNRPSDIRHRMSIIQRLAIETTTSLRNKGILPPDPFKYTSIYLDRDRQLKEVTTADRVVSFLSSKGIKHNERRIRGMVNCLTLDWRRATELDASSSLIRKFRLTKSDVEVLAALQKERQGCNNDQG